MDLKRINPHLATILRENTTEQQWGEFIDQLRLELQGRITATADEELPKLKHQITYLGELRNTFTDIFHTGK